MHKIIGLGVASALVIGVVGFGLAGPERVAYPTGYADTFTLYNMIDRLDRNVVRFMYVNPDAHAGAQAGEPAPDGTILIMEDHPAQLDGNGNPVLGPDGRLIATDEVTNVFVMEKQPGWGEAYPAETRNGDWDYAWYLADGSPRPEASFDGCFACHLNRSDADYTFSYSAYLRDRDGM